MRQQRHNKTHFVKIDLDYQTLKIVQNENTACYMYCILQYFLIYQFVCVMPIAHESFLCRYMIPRYTDVEQFFSINAEDGMITTTRPLDREAQPWHNISVSATEIGMYAL